MSTEQEQAAAEEWREDRNGREYIPRVGRSGIIVREGLETPEQARARDAQPRRDKRPRAKSKRPKMPPAPAKVDLKELERDLAEVFRAPAMACAAFGDEWAANHFQQSGPYLARNLVMAAEHNEWLRRKLEEASTGQDMAMMMLSLVPVSGAVIAYALPPLVWWLNLPVPDKTKQMFGIPDKNKDAQGPAPTPPTDLAQAA